MLSLANRDAARTFVWLNARLLDRHRYAYLFEGGDAEPVLAALRPHQNPGGGFGHALEPDSRGPSSHPATADAALRVLDELEAVMDLGVCWRDGHPQALMRVVEGVAGGRVRFFQEWM